jgi:hypothetical protein
MKRTQLILAAILLGGLTFLALPSSTEAAPPVRVVATPGYRPAVQPNVNHMPGWDWQRTYPWSAYNYGRNPYNPIVVPYPVYSPYVYPAYVPQTTYYPNYYYYYGTPAYPLGVTIGQ